VTEGTHLLHAVIMAHGKSIRERLAIAREPGFNRQAVRQISGLSYTYRDVVPVPPGLQPLPGPAAGDRAPDVLITPRLRLYDLLRHHYYTVLVFQCEPHSRAEEFTQTLADRFGDRVRVRVIASQGLGVFARPGAVIAEDTAAHDLYGALDGDTICLVRPDGYLALRCRSAEHEAVTTLLDSVLV
jgi:NADPH-dependent dioxygenase